MKQRKPGCWVYWPDSLPMLAIILFAGTRGLAYLPFNEPDQLPGGLQLLAEGLGGSWWVTVYAVLWLATAVCGLVGLFSRKAALVGYLPTMFLSSLVTSAYTLSWISSIMDPPLPPLVSGVNRDWLTAVTYLVPVILLIPCVARNRRQARLVEQTEGTALAPFSTLSDLASLHFQQVMTAVLENRVREERAQWWGAWLEADQPTRVEMEQSILQEWSSRLPADREAGDGGDPRHDVA